MFFHLFVKKILFSELKKSLYTFSDDLFKINEIIEDKTLENNKVFYNIYYYLLEKTQAIPVLDNILFFENVFDDFSLK